MLYTSYFAFVQKIPAEFLAAVAGGVPPGFAGMHYRKLAPKKDWWRQWHDEGLPNEWYIQKYNETVLNRLEPAEVLRELGDNKILPCWEAPGKFCHRHLIAEWLNKNTGIDVQELSIIKKREFFK